MIDYGALIQLIGQIADAMGTSTSQTGYAHGSGGNKYEGMQSWGKQTHDPITSGVGAYLAGREDKRKRKKIKKRLEEARRKEYALATRGLSQQEQATRKGLAQQLGGFEEAKRTAATRGRTAKETALRRGQELEAQTVQDLSRRGLGSITSGVGRGISADVSRRVGEVDESLGQYFGQLAMGRAATEAGGTAALSDLAAQRTNLDIGDVNFWTPYNWSEFGRMSAKINQGGNMYYGSGIDLGMFGNMFGGGGGGMGGGK